MIGGLIARDVRRGLTGAAVFYDYLTTEADRYTFSFAIAAAEHGAELANHVEAVEMQLSRAPRSLPEMRLEPSVTSIFDFKYEDFRLVGYDPHPAIPAPVSV